MAAPISTEMFARTSHTPEFEDSDSDNLVLALETARALEAQGDFREAAKWLRRAADQAERDGNDARVLVLARAAADLTTLAGPPRLATPVPSSAPPSQGGSSRAKASGPVPAPHTPPPPPSPPRVSSAPASAPRASSRSAPQPRGSSVPTSGPRVSEKSVGDRAAPAPTVRVAIPISASDANVFVDKRLKKGQALPPGTTEATLVLGPVRD
jgi:hypothetical protein